MLVAMQDVATRPERAPRTWPVKVRRILLATDLSPASDLATDWALDLARHCDAALLVLSVIDDARVDAPRGHARIERDTRARAIVDRGRRCGVPVATLVWIGHPAESIVEAARAEEVDVVVVGARDRDGEPIPELGSVSAQVVRDAACPVLVVRMPHPSGVAHRN